MNAENLTALVLTLDALSRQRDAIGDFPHSQWAELRAANYDATMATVRAIAREMACDDEAKEDTGQDAVCS